MNPFKDRLPELRKKAGLTQESLATALGLSAGAVGRWEAGYAKPSLHHRRAMSKIFSVPLEEFLEKSPIEIDSHREEDEPDLKRYVDQAISAMRSEFKSALEHERPDIKAERPLKIKTPERKPKRINRREELPRYHISRTGKGLKAPQWLNLAAENGCDLENSEDYIYLEETNGKAGLHTAVVRGRSMEDTLIPGDMIVLEEFGGGPLHLHPRGDDPKNSYRVLSARLPQDSICVLSINDDAPTLKRISYDFSRGVLDWRLMIIAENLIEWAPRAVSRNDAVTFWAKMVGIIESPDQAGSI